MRTSPQTRFRAPAATGGLPETRRGAGAWRSVRGWLMAVRAIGAITSTVDWIGSRP